MHNLQSTNGQAPKHYMTSHSRPPLSIFEESHEWTIIWSDKKEEGKLNGKCFLVFVSAWSVLYNWLHMLKSDYIINTHLDWLSTSSIVLCKIFMKWGINPLCNKELIEIISKIQNSCFHFYMHFSYLLFVIHRVLKSP